MIKTVLTTTIIATSMYLVSCSSPEPTHEEKIESTVTTYLDDLFEEEKTVKEYAIDSIEINDISPKVSYQLEISDKTKELQSTIDEAKVLRKEYEDRKGLGDMYGDLLGNKEDAFSKSNGSSLDELNEAFKTKKELADQMLVEIEEMTVKAETMDSISVAYYEVIARGSITSTTNVQKEAIYPFHISTDYKILREPLELINRQQK